MYLNLSVMLQSHAENCGPALPFWGKEMTPFLSESCNSHLASFSGERPFVCLICLSAFTTKANCERHLKVHTDTLNGKLDSGREVRHETNPSQRPVVDTLLFLVHEPLCKANGRLHCWRWELLFCPGSYSPESPAEASHG